MGVVCALFMERIPMIILWFVLALLRTGELSNYKVSFLIALTTPFVSEVSENGYAMPSNKSISSLPIETDHTKSW